MGIQKLKVQGNVKLTFEGVALVIRRVIYKSRLDQTILSICMGHKGRVRTTCIPVLVLRLGSLRA